MATVSVLILTYNHVRFIAQAIESVLSQRMPYQLKLVIVEDCSTDGTQEIVKEYAARYPEVITAHLHRQNVGKTQGIQEVVYEGFRKLDGDYIALLEGDDYWSSSDKLAKQVGFLEAHSEFVACAHNTVKVYEDNSVEPHRFLYWEDTKEVHDIRDFAGMASFFHISSLVFRNMRLLKGEGMGFQYIRNRWCCDIFFTMVHTQFGKLRYFNEDLSVYRAHSGGNFSNMPALKGRIFNIEGHRRFNYWLRYRHLKDCSSAIRRLCEEMLSLSKAGALPPLSLLQRAKYRWLGGFYGVIADALAARDGLNFRYRGFTGDSLIREVVLKPVYWINLVILFLFIAVTTAGVWLWKVIVPRALREAAGRASEKALWHEEAGHLCWLWKEGRLFSDKGAYHFKQLMRVYVGRLRGCCAPLLRRSRRGQIEPKDEAAR